MRAAALAAALLCGALALASPSSSSTPAAAPYKCTSPAGCELLGTCTAGACVCLPGWTGPSCGSLDLAPASTAARWPRDDDIGAGAASAWGFSAVFDPADGLYHALVTVACGAADVVGQGGGGSWIAHVSSSLPDRGFTLAAMFTPQVTFGPHVVVRPSDGAFVAIFRVNALANTTLCSGNGTAAGGASPAELLAGAYIKDAQLTPGDPEKGTSIYIASAARMSGPWSVVRASITGAGELHKSNPSLAYLRDGRLLLGYRYNSKVGELNAFAVAAPGAPLEGPYACITNLTRGKPGDEDPFVWQQPNDGSLHAVYHNAGAGYHAFADEAGIDWFVSPTGSHAFTLNVTLEGGAVLPLGRRERPELEIGPDGVPVRLWNGVQAANTSCFAMAQPVNGGA